MVDADAPLDAIEMVLAMTTDPGDISSTNLETINAIFRIVAENETIEMGKDAFETATTILSQLQRWGLDNTARKALQNISAE